MIKSVHLGESNFTNNHSHGFVVSRAMMLKFVVIQIFTLLTLVTELSYWFIALASLCLLWQVAIYQHKLTKPSKIIKVFVALTGCILLFISSKEMGILLSMVHLLCLAYLLKPLELNRRNDLYQLVVLSLFILVTSFIFYQSIYFTIYVICLLVVCFAWLINFYSSDKSLINASKLSGKMLLQSLPLAIILFVFFPKISPFWHVPIANSAKSGLTDKVTIGDVSSLALSNELAFRVEFKGTAARYSQMYWRAIVLDKFDGVHWSKNIVSKQDVRDNNTFINTLTSNSKTLEYQVIAEPSYQHWLFALDVAELKNVDQNKVIFQLKNYTLFSRDKIANSLSYHIKSHTNLPLDKRLSEINKAKNLKVVAESNPKLLLYAQQLRSRLNDDNLLIQKVLSDFREQNYRYTLTPPVLKNNSLDQFYFETKAGFCEHFASSFTFLMRAAGIPSRMVLGYLGGEYNIQGNYYSVYQRDAHAWSEVWLREKGWVRIDPTASVDPSRVERGFSQQLLDEQELLSSEFSFNAFYSKAWVNFLKAQFDALDYQWTKMVINFSQEKQTNLLSDWFGRNFHLKRALMIAFALLFSALLIWGYHRLSQRKKPKEPWLLLIEQTQNKIEKLGIKRINNQSEEEYLSRLQNYNESIAHAYQLLLRSYLTLRYERLSSQKQQQLLKKMNKQYSAFNQTFRAL